MIYDFRKQLDKGKSVEISLDNFFKKWYNIETVTIDEERSQGIDRVFTSLSTGKVTRIEYKADFKTKDTGNIYLELSVDGDNGYHKDGWALRSTADLILYTIIYETEYLILGITPGNITKHIPEWSTKFRTAKCRNVGYGSTGLLIPLDNFSSIASKKFVCSVVEV